MAVFVALNHPNDTLRVNITMTDDAVRGTVASGGDIYRISGLWPRRILSNPLRR
jgi:hypothetical protein